MHSLGRFARQIRLRLEGRWRRAFLLPLLLLGGSAGSAAETPTPEAAAPSVVFLGDSLAAGYGVDPSDAYPSLVGKWIHAAGLPHRVVNAGLSGDTTAGGVRRIDWILKRPVEVLVLELGGNDGLRGMSPSQTRSNLVAIIQKARTARPRIRIVLAGMQMPSNLGADYTREFRDLYPAIARSQSVDLIPFLLDGVGGVASLNQADQIHPNAEGHRRVATNVWAVLEGVLRTPPPAGTNAAPSR